MKLSSAQQSEVTAVTKAGLIDRIVGHQRELMHAQFLLRVLPAPGESLLDVGASAEPALTSSNHLERSPPPGVTVTACGLGYTNDKWKEAFPAVEYIHGNALDLPFPDNAFDVVYSHAVIEHVGLAANQQKMLAELTRVARRAVWVTTPNRWHPIEFHSFTPLIHWLPIKGFHTALKFLGKSSFADVSVLNLIGKSNIESFFIDHPTLSNCEHEILPSAFLGFTGNWLLQIKKPK